jgi:ABC-type sugar transport system ATPase subunit
MVYVTHDQVEAMTMADKIVVLNGGHIEQVGSPMDLYRKPRTPFVAGFIGSPRMNLYDGQVAQENGCSTYGIRPEDIVLSSTEGRWSGRVQHIERLGADAILYLQVDGLGQLIARDKGDSPYQVGSMVWARPIPGLEHKF